nr:hypothetical protein [Tanacetum cinerariifolium]
MDRNGHFYERNCITMLNHTMHDTPCALLRSFICIGTTYGFNQEITGSQWRTESLQSYPTITPILVEDLHLQVLANTWMLPYNSSECRL